MKKLLFIFLIACGSTPQKSPQPDKDTMIFSGGPIDTTTYWIDTTTTWGENTGYITPAASDTIPVVILYSDTLLRTGIYSVAAMDGYIIGNALVDQVYEPLYPSYLVWKTIPKK